jgi:hypothetical protein
MHVQQSGLVVLIFGCANCKQCMPCHSLSECTVPKNSFFNYYSMLTLPLPTMMQTPDRGTVLGAFPSSSDLDKTSGSLSPRWIGSSRRMATSTPLRSPAMAAHLHGALFQLTHSNLEAFRRSRCPLRAHAWFDASCSRLSEGLVHTF